MKRKLLRQALVCNKIKVFKVWLKAIKAAREDDLDAFERIERNLESPQLSGPFSKKKKDNSFTQMINKAYAGCS